MFDPDRFEHELADALAGDHEIVVDDHETIPAAYDELEADYDDEVATDPPLYEDGELDDSELGDDPSLEHELEADLACRYQPGEIAVSRTNEGVLPIDVYPHPQGGIIVADFGVARRSPKPGAGESALMKRWIDGSNLQLSRTHGQGIEIVGYTDCVGAEGINDRLRRARARAMRDALGPLFQRAAVRASARGERLGVDTATPSGRAMNRGVWIHVPTRSVTFDAGDDYSADPKHHPKVVQRWPVTPWDRKRDGDPVKWLAKGAHPPRDRPHALDFWKGWKDRVLALVTSKPGLKWVKPLGEAAVELIFRPWIENRKWKPAVEARSNYANAYAHVLIEARALASQDSVTDNFPGTHEALLARFVREPSDHTFTSFIQTAARIDAVERMNTLLQARGKERLRGLLQNLRIGDDPRYPDTDKLRTWISDVVGGRRQ